VTFLLGKWYEGFKALRKPTKPLSSTVENGWKSNVNSPRRCCFLIATQFFRNVCGDVCLCVLCSVVGSSDAEVSAVIEADVEASATF
jgi:hypothetical protein